MLEKKKYEPALTIRVSNFRKLDSNTTLTIILMSYQEKNLF